MPPAPAGDSPEDHPDNSFKLPQGDPLKDKFVEFFGEQAAQVLGSNSLAGAKLPASFPPLSDYDDPMASAMTPTVGAYWDWGGKATRVKLGLDPFDWKVTDPHLAKTIAAATLKFCKSTNATTSKKLDDALAALREELHEGIIDEGESIPELRKRVQAIFAGLSRDHAELIARTESSRAVHSAALQSAAESGVVEAKRWLASANSCDRCRALEAETKAKPVPLDGLFEHGGGDYGDVQTAPAHPLCRCTIIMVLTDSYVDLVEAAGFACPPEVAPLDPASPAVPAPKPKKPRAPRKPKPKPEPAPASPPAPAHAPAPPAAGGFPADPNKLEVVKPLGGSTGAELVRSPDGTLYVRKRGANPGHLREEVLADDAYRRLGAKVPESKLYETEAGPVKLARYVEGATPLGKLPAAARAAAEAKLARHFAADALLGNWDVLGADADNVLVDKAGEVWRVDNGGSLRYRAQGAPKGAAWNDHPMELWTMRSPGSGAQGQAAAAFGKLKFAEVLDQVDAIKATGASLGFPPEIAGTIDRRLGELRHTSRVGRTFLDDAWRDGYADGVARHSIGIRSAGIVGRMPDSLHVSGPSGVAAVDQDGRPWDHLRGSNSIVGDLHKYMDGNGGSSKTIQFYCSGQAGSSWSESAQAMKALLVSERTGSPDAQWWRDGHTSAQAMLASVANKAGGHAKYRETAMMQHAFTHELLNKAQWATKGKDGRTVRLIRTESSSVMREARLELGAKGATMKRGGLESFSVFKKCTVYGNETTIQEMPLHRVFVSYFQSRRDGDPTGALLGENENEFVCIPDRVQFDYVARTPSTPAFPAPKKAPKAQP